VFLDCGAGKGGDLWGAVIRKNVADTSEITKQFAELSEQLALTETDSYDHIKISGDLEILDRKLKEAANGSNNIEYVNFGR
jgi:hypothetical protein